jgi:hypothetical protein
MYVYTYIFIYIYIQGDLARQMLVDKDNIIEQYKTKEAQIVKNNNKTNQNQDSLPNNGQKSVSNITQRSPNPHTPHPGSQVFISCFCSLKLSFICHLSLVIILIFLYLCLFGWSVFTYRKYFVAPLVVIYLIYLFSLSSKPPVPPTPVWRHLR